MNALDLLISLISDALDTQVEAFAREIEQQGHRNTGKLIDSLTKSVKIEQDKIKAQVSSIDYGVYVSGGVSADRVNYSPDVLRDWARERLGLSGKELESVIWAIWQTHKKEGIPSRGSYSFSNNGYRKSWIERGIELNATEFDNKVIQALGQFATKLIEQELQNAQIKLAA